MTADGIMTMRFNKPVLMPNIKTSTSGDESKRALQGEITVEDFVEMRIKDADFADEELDKGMCSFFLDEVDETLLRIGIEFCNPSDITEELQEPDILQIFMRAPEMIVDAATYESLQSEEFVYEVELQPQMTSDELMLLIEAA